MTSNLDSREPSSHDRAVNLAYLREVWIGVAGYVLVLGAALLWGHLDGTSPWRFVWALIPVIPALWIPVAVFRHIRRVDEYQRFIILQGLGVGFALAMIASITVGFLGIAGMDPMMAPWIIYLVGMLGWFVATQISKRR